MQMVNLTTAEEWAWFRARTSVILCEDMKGVVAYDMEGRILGACVADSFGPDNCNVHIAIDSHFILRRGFLDALAKWLFIQLDRKRLFGLVPSNNLRAIKFNEHIGFREVARVPHAVSEGVDYIVYAMGRDDCRWLETERRAA